MKGKEGAGFPVEGDGTLRLKYAEDGDIGHVTFAGGGEGAVEGDIEGSGFRVALEVYLGGGLRAHGVAAGGADADPIEFA